jgi:SAM-dependent methyltransferase
VKSWSPSETAVETSFRILLLRAPDDTERRNRSRVVEGGQAEDELNRSLLGSAEFRQVYEGLTGRGDLGRNPDVVAREVLSGVGDGATFVAAAYRCFLGRDADEAGAAYYVERLAKGVSYLSVIKALAQSDEFEARYQEICPQVGLIPHDTQLCELANPAKWDNPEWVSFLRSVGTVPPDKLSMHRKAYEVTQTLFGLERLGRLRGDVRFLSVGAGHEAILYWLANRVGYVVATDTYEAGWKEARAGEGDEDVVRRPEEFAPFPYKKERLVFSKMSGRSLGLLDESFDVAYSLSSIEHFGGFEGGRDAVDEMARVVKSGGLIVVATEYLLSGPRTDETFPPEEIHALAERPGLKLLHPLDEQVYDRYQVEAVDLRTNAYQTPQMLVRNGDTVFTSVMLFLEKL